MADKTSAMKAALRGLASGGTMGFSDELGGAEQAGLNGLAKHAPKIADMLGIETRYPEGLGDSGDVYKQTRDQNRAEDKQAEADHPVIYNGAEIVGGLVPGMAGGIGSGAKAGASAAKVAARTYATKAAEKAAGTMAANAAKKAALQSMIRQGAIQGGINAYGNGEKSATDLGNLGDMADGAVGGAGGALIGHGIAKGAAKLAGYAPSISKGVKRLIKPEQEVARTIKNVGAGSDRARAAEAMADKLANEFEDKGAAQVSAHNMKVQGMLEGNGLPHYKAKPTKGLKGKELMDAIGDNLDYNDTDFSDLLPADGMTDKMAPDRAAKLARASAETNAGGKASKAAADEGEEVFLKSLQKKKD